MTNYFQFLSKDQLSDYQKKSVHKRLETNKGRHITAYLIYKNDGIEEVKRVYQIKERQAFNLIKKGKERLNELDYFDTPDII